MDLPANAAAGDVDAIVQAPAKRIQQTLHVGGSESRQHHLLDIGDAITVGVLAVKQIRSVTDEQPAVEGKNRRRPEQAIDEDVGLVVRAVTDRYRSDDECEKADHRDSRYSRASRKHTSHPRHPIRSPPGWRREVPRRPS